MSKLTHIDDKGDPVMVDVSGKEETVRTAEASGVIRITPAMVEAIEGDNIKKGDVLTIAKLAGVMAVKKTPDLIPLCHPLLISGAKLSARLDKKNCEIHFTARVSSTGPTGVEMEALSAVSAACLTAYDMLKALDKGMEIGEIKLLSKTGGKSGDYVLKEMK
jgi:cyclic pyranopterin monophosphate synthase